MVPPHRISYLPYIIILSITILIGGSLTIISLVIFSKKRQSSIQRNGSRLSVQAGTSINNRYHKSTGHSSTNHHKLFQYIRLHLTISDAIILLGDCSIEIRISIAMCWFISVMCGLLVLLVNLLEQNSTCTTWFNFNPNSNRVNGTYLSKNNNKTLADIIQEVYNYYNMITAFWIPLCLIVSAQMYIAYATVHEAIQQPKCQEEPTTETATSTQFTTSSSIVSRRSSRYNRGNKQQQGRLERNGSISRQRQMNRSHKLLKQTLLNTLAITSSYVICWTPYNIIKFIQPDHTNIWHYVMIYSYHMLPLNSLIHQCINLTDHYRIKRQQDDQLQLYEMSQNQSRSPMMSQSASMCSRQTSNNNSQLDINITDEGTNVRRHSLMVEDAIRRQY